MKKVLLITIFTCLNILFSCKPAQINKNDLLGKRFVKIAFSMGSEYLEFSGTNKINFSVIDKLHYGYEGTFTFESDKKGRQFVKIVNDKKDLTVVFLVKSTTKLEVFSATPTVYKSANFPNGMNIKHEVGTTFELDN